MPLPLIDAIDFSLLRRHYADIIAMPHYFIIIDDG
jgi:hypothetical protein